MKQEIAFISLALFIIAIGFVMINPQFIGYVTVGDELSYSKTINQSFDFRNADHTTEARLRQQAAVIQENTRRSIYQDMQDGGSISKLTGRR